MASIQSPTALLPSLLRAVTENLVGYAALATTGQWRALAPQAQETLATLKRLRELEPRLCQGCDLAAIESRLRTNNPETVRGALQELREAIDRYQRDKLAALTAGMLAILDELGEPSPSALFRPGPQAPTASWVKMRVLELRQSLGGEIFDAQRYRSTRVPGSASGFTEKLPFRVDLDGQTQVSVDYDPKSGQILVPSLLNGGITYQRSSDSPWQVRIDPASGGADDSATLLLRGLHGTRPIFPRPQVQVTSDAEGHKVIELPADFAVQNQRYFIWCQGELRESEMTIGYSPQSSQPLTELVAHRAIPTSLDLPQPEIQISVAKNGHFVGFITRMPHDANPRGTYYFVGTPESGNLVRVGYESYLNPADLSGWNRITGYRWTTPTGKYSPNRLQRRAVELWFQSFGLKDPPWENAIPTGKTSF